MQLIEKTKKILDRGALAHFPNSHLVAISMLSACLLSVSFFSSEEASATRNVSTIELPIMAINDETPLAEPIAHPITAETVPEPEYQLTSVKVKSGDNLSLIFKRAGLSDRHMMELLNSNKKAKRLAAVYPGHTLTFGIDDEQQLQQLTYEIDQLNSFKFSRDEQGFSFNEISREPDIHYAQRSAFISQSLYAAGMEAKLDDKLIMELADVFGWDIDFALDIRKGDHFKVVYEERFLDGEKIGNGSIVAAEFVNQGETFKAVRYVNARGDTSYYTPKGRSMRKEFLRAPLDFRRISSNFNPRRLHPVLKTRRPHRGIDYAASTGTPVWSSGNGRVIASGYTKANGNYVVIQHGNSVQTKYLHLHKRYVKKGQRVKQKQKIGTVGSTGLATGPHLHYEFLMNGVHRNPRTIISKLPKAKSISKDEMQRFYEQTKVLVVQLNESLLPNQYATSGSESDTKRL